MQQKSVKRGIMVLGREQKNEKERRDPVLRWIGENGRQFVTSNINTKESRNGNSNREKSRQGLSF